MPIRRERAVYASAAGERNDCAVRALSVAANMPYTDAYALFADAGRQPGCGTYPWTSAKVFERLGFDQVVVRYERSLTLTQFVKAHPVGRYTVHRRGHAFALIDGVVHDWSVGSGPRSRVRRAWRVG